MKTTLLAGKMTVILFLLFLSFIYPMFQGGFVSWFIFYSFLPFGLYSLLISLYPMSFFSVSRSINKNQFIAGEKLRATVIIKRRLPCLPLLYLIVKEELPASLSSCQQSKSSKVILFPWFRQTVQMEYIIDSVPRGEHIFTSISLKTGDLFGLIEKEGYYQLETKYLVYPNWIEIPYQKLENRYDQGNTTSRLRLIRDTTMAVGVREYQPGDKFSWIDWKASARRNTIMTKEFEQQQSHDLVVFMDKSVGQSQAIFEQVVVFSASIVRSIIKSGAQVGFVSNGRNRFATDLKGTEYHQQQIYYHLAKVQPDNRLFAESIEAEISNWHKGLSMVFITGQLLDTFVRTIERLVSKHYQVMVFVIVPKQKPIDIEIMSKIDSLKQQRIFVKAIVEGQYLDAFHEVRR
jgi:uncharacterized protein (DUF58 family)